MRALVLLLSSCLVVGCTSTVRFTRTVPPVVGLAGRPLSVEVTTNEKARNTNSLFNTLAGSLNVPTDSAGELREHVTARLAKEANVTVCAAKPCGDGDVQLTITESQVGVEEGNRGVRAFAKVTAKVVVTRADGVVEYQDSLWSRQTDNVVLAPQLLSRACNGVAGVLVDAFLPTTVKVELPVEEDGPLAHGAALLLSGDLDGAERALTEVTTKQPNLAGAYYDLGLVAEVRGDSARAAQLHRQAASLDPKQEYLDAADSAARDAARFQRQTQ